MYWAANTSFCGSQVRLRSAKTSHLGSVYVTMVNGTGGSVTAWWVDFDGNEVRTREYLMQLCSSEADTARSLQYANAHAQEQLARSAFCFQSHGD